MVGADRMTIVRCPNCTDEVAVPLQIATISRTYESLAIRWERSVVEHRCPVRHVEEADNV